MIVYKRTDGLAHDLRYEDDGYVLLDGEASIQGWDALPELATLHEDSAAEKLAQTSTMARKRADALRALEDARLAAAVSDPNAPPAVREYAEMIRS